MSRIAIGTLVLILPGGIRYELVGLTGTVRGYVPKGGQCRGIDGTWFPKEHRHDVEVPNFPPRLPARMWAFRRENIIPISPDEIIRKEEQEGVVAFMALSRPLNIFLNNGRTEIPQLEELT